MALLDPEVFAFDANAHWRGRQQGVEEGLADGRAKGYKAGHADGHTKGWNDAIDHATERILADQQAFAADKASLTAKVDEQARVIETLKQRLTAAEQTVGALRRNDGVHESNQAAVVENNEALRAQNEQLREMLSASEAANQRLQAQVNTLEERNAAIDQKYRDQVVEFNNASLLVRTALTVIDSVTTGDGAQPRATRELFEKSYAANLKEGLDRGFVKNPLQTDPLFAGSMPKTRAWLLDMLQRVAHDKANPLVELKPLVLVRAAAASEPAEPAPVYVPPKGYGSPQPAPRRLTPKVEQDQDRGSELSM